MASHDVLVSLSVMLFLIIFAHSITLSVGAFEQNSAFNGSPALHNAILIGLIATAMMWASYGLEKPGVQYSGRRYVAVAVGGAAAFSAMVLRTLPFMVATVYTNVTHPADHSVYCADGVFHNNTVCNTVRADGIFAIFEYIILFFLTITSVHRAMRALRAERSVIYEESRYQFMKTLGLGLVGVTFLGLIVWTIAWLWVIDKKQYYAVALQPFDVLYLAVGVSVAALYGVGDNLVAAIVCLHAFAFYLVDFVFRTRSQDNMCGNDSGLCKGLKAASTGEGMWLFSQILLCGIFFVLRKYTVTTAVKTYEEAPPASSVPYQSVTVRGV